jgi:hypothetical protein
VSEWLDLMLEEIARKRQERDEALQELERRNQADEDAAKVTENRFRQVK